MKRAAHQAGSQCLGFRRLRIIFVFSQVRYFLFLNVKLAFKKKKGGRKPGQSKILTSTIVTDAIFEAERQRDLKRKKKEGAKENEIRKTIKGMQTQKTKLAKLTLHFSDSSYDATSVDLSDL